MGKHSISPLATGLIEEAHQLLHGDTLGVQAKVVDSLELACV
jgi:hypothetical protein